MIDFENVLKSYIDDINKTHTEASKTFYFLEFIRKIFSSAEIDRTHVLFPILEKFLKKEEKERTLTIKGRADALLGNIIIEFKTDLEEDKLSTAIEELTRYISIIWSNEKNRVKYLLMASDGIEIIVYRPRLIEESIINIEQKDIELDLIDNIKLDEVDHNFAFLWLDRYILYKTLLTPSTENFLEVFGKDSPVYKQIIGLLKDKWQSIENDDNIKVLYDEWSRYLEIVYGGEFGKVSLYLRHTYLVTLCKLIAFTFYSGGAIPTPNQIINILNGHAFTKWGINNFLEEDFFAWILRVSDDFCIEIAKHIIEHLTSFEITEIDEDILKGLYQSLVDPEERHDLGEYYTPDWLATYMVHELILDPNKRVLDPACGSGTFLVETIKVMKEFLLKENKTSHEILEHVVNNVVGVDILPLAVIISKVNFLLALGDIVRYKKNPITIPVYLADTMKLPKHERTQIASDEDKKILVPVYTLGIEKKIQLQIPEMIAKSTELLHDVLKNIKILAQKEDMDKKETHNQLKSRLKSYNFENRLLTVLTLLTDKIRNLVKQKRDTIWIYVIKNIYKPIFLQEDKFDIIIGNPPWISYRYMNEDYQEFVKDQVINTYNLLSAKKQNLITHMEFASLFFIRSAHLYLKNNGFIGFVLPRSFFVADQHNDFREGKYNLQDKKNLENKIKITSLYDLDKVKPLFKINTCVIIGKKGLKTTYPIKGKEFIGKLPRKNANLIEAKEHLTIEENDYFLNRIGERTFISKKKMEIALSERYYLKQFKQGATLTPRNFWFVDFIKHPKLGINPDKPYIETSKKIIKVAKPKYKDFITKGNIEKDFLYATLRGSEVVPFAHLPFLVVGLPVTQTKTKYKILEKEDAQIRGFDGLVDILEKNEKNWKKANLGKKKLISIYERINKFKGIISQNHSIRFKVLYLTSGTHLAACVIDNENENFNINLNGIEIILNGFIADTKTYYFETINENEAYYLTGILNAPIVDNLIKDMQSKGLFGPRDIHKKVLELPIPKFNQKNSDHQKITKLSKKCEEEAKKLLPTLITKYKSIASIRNKIREYISDELEQISEIVINIFEEKTGKGTLTSFL